MNILDLYLRKEFKQLLKNLYNIEVNDNDLLLEIPPKKDLGDYSFPCFGVSKLLKKNPIQIGQEIINFVNVNYNKNSIFFDFQLAGPYLNFKINKSFLSKIFIESLEEITKILDEKNKSKKIVVDYIGTNVGKPLHIGHMCTPNQGQVIINIYRKLGYDVIGDSHIGDWGIIFGKLICAYKLWGNEQKLIENPIDYLLELYVKATNESENHSHLDEEFRNEFKNLSEGNSKSIELWKKFTRYSIDAMQKELDRLYVKPDYDIGESFYEGLGFPKMGNYPDLTYSMKDIVKELIEKGIASKNDDGSVGVIFDENLKIPSCILQKRDGTHGYLASDLAAVKYRMQNWNPEKILYFVDVRQQLHLKQVFQISKLAGWLNINTELFHAYNGFISLKDGAMSTRKGRIIKLEALLDEAEERARKIILEKRQDLQENELKELSKIIGIGAIKYGYLSKNRITDVVFDWDEFMTFEGNSGPYIQYAYVRAKQIIEKSGLADLSINQNIESLSFEYDEEIDLVSSLFNYKSILLETASTCSPHILCNYSYNLTKKFNSFYNKVHILSEEDNDKKKLKLNLVFKFIEVLNDSFNIIGIDMPERM
nr:arginine--tRNA ligase [Candidatus Gracilibacteria bacterium]